MVDVETMPPAPVVGLAPGQGQMRPVAVPSGVALEEPAVAPNAGDLAPVDGVSDDPSPKAKPEPIMPRPHTVPEMSWLLDK